LELHVQDPVFFRTHILVKVEPGGMTMPSGMVTSPTKLKLSQKLEVAPATVGTTGVFVAGSGVADAAMVGEAIGTGVFSACPVADFMASTVFATRVLITACSNVGWMEDGGGVDGLQADNKASISVI
jgi:hypothetical protein